VSLGRNLVDLRRYNAALAGWAAEPTFGPERLHDGLAALGGDEVHIVTTVTLGVGDEFAEVATA